jgi:hypothetical protein
MSHAKAQRRKGRKLGATVGYVQRSPVQQHIKHMIHQAPFIACEGFKQRTAEHTRAPMSHAKEQRREGGERFFV